MRIPLWVEASRLKVLVLGGGAVGTRRAKFFASSGAKVRVIAREVSDELKKLSVEIKIADLNEYDPAEDIEWADIVVVAVSDRELADRLFRLASERGKLVNDATDASRTHVVVPYERVVEGLRVAVTSEGAAGTPARLSLDVIEECIKRSWIPTFFKAYKALKAEAKERIPDVRRRLDFYDALWRDEAFRTSVFNGDVDAAVERGREIMRQYI